MLVRYVAAPSKQSTDSDQEHSDLLDRSLRKGAWRVLRSWTPSPQWVPAIERVSVSSSTERLQYWRINRLLQVVLAMSDQQLVTGLSIIISGYSRLHCGDLAHGDWRSVTQLAWFSSVTHLATLLFLRQHLQRRRWIMYVRVLLMAALAMMLAVAIVPSAVVPTGVVPKIGRAHV